VVKIKKNGYGMGIAKMGMGIVMSMSIGPTRPILAPYMFYQYPPYTHLILAPYKTHTRLLKVLICYL